MLLTIHLCPDLKEWLLKCCPVDALENIWQLETHYVHQIARKIIKVEGKSQLQRKKERMQNSSTYSTVLPTEAPKKYNTEKQLTLKMNVIP